MADVTPGEARALADHARMDRTPAVREALRSLAAQVERLTAERINGGMVVQTAEARVAELEKLLREARNYARWVAREETPGPTTHRARVLGAKITAALPKETDDA